MKIEGLRLEINVTPTAMDVVVKGTDMTRDVMYTFQDKGLTLPEIVKEFQPSVTLDDLIHICILDSAIGGLLADKKEHKQWYLEEILKALYFDLEEVIKLLKEDGYKPEKGICPPHVK